MRVCLKVFALVILVLSLFLVANPQPSEAASAVEYGLGMTGTGYIVSVTSKGQASFDLYKMTLNMSSNVLYDPPGNPQTPGTNQGFCTGEIILTDANGKVDSTMVTGTMDLTSLKFTITTITSSRSLSGTMQADSSLPLKYQNFSNGSSGYFILYPGAPAP